MTKLFLSLANGIFCLLDWVFSILSFELVLLMRPNGGFTIFIRTFLMSLVIYLLAIAVKSYSCPTAILTFSWVQFRFEISETIPWFGAIFGGIYAALYTRFSSQWTYLADLYNQQLSTAITATQDERESENYAIWQAAFIEDAVCMHLAKKPGFCFAIYQMLTEVKIREILETDQHFGEKRVKKLILSLEKTLKVEQRNPKLQTDVIK